MEVEFEPINIPIKRWRCETAVIQLLEDFCQKFLLKNNHLLPSLSPAGVKVCEHGTMCQLRNIIIPVHNTHRHLI